ncbi:uncharacterized protein O3C94_011617 [Discoglossus pictus]
MLFAIFSLCIFVELMGQELKNSSCPSLCRCSEENVISCDNLGFQSLPADLPTSAVSLNLAGNLFRIVTFNAFRVVPSLQILWLNQNNLTFLFPGAFLGLSNLRELNLSKNPRLTYLHAHTFRGLLNLMSLDMSHCNIFEFHPLVFSHLLSLEALDLGSNKIHYIPQSLRKLHSITKLSLESNRIEAIGHNSFNFPQALQDLNLRRNRIWAIENDAFNQLNKLNVLNLGHNSISHLPKQLFSGLTQLKTIYLEANKIYTINCSFNSLISLKKLHLNNNHITHITHNAFISLEQLELLHLSKNNLTSIPSYLFLNMPRLKHVFLSFNPWSCDCRMAWTADWLLTYKGVIKGLHCVFALSHKSPSEIFAHNGAVCTQEENYEDDCIEVTISTAPKLLISTYIVLFLILFENIYILD